MEGQIINLLDYILLPFYLAIIFVIANKFKNSKYPPGHPWRPYFIPGLIAKIVGAVGIGLIYQYYYGGGDTFNYFYHAQVINSSFTDSPSKWFNLILGIPKWYDADYAEYIQYKNLFWYGAPKEYTVACIAAFIGLFTFTTYLPTCVIFGALSFTGIWALFRTFATKYPLYVKYIAICTLFIPSTVMWGSGIFKDTICMCCLGWMTYSAFRLLINRDFSIKNVVAIIVCFYLVATIKVYILLAFLPALVLWILFTYSHRIQNSFGRFFLKIAVLGGCVVGFLVFSQKFASSLGEYSLENLGKTSLKTSSYIASVSKDEGSAYNLGNLDPSFGGMLKSFFPAVNVSLFRPYLWETKKPIQFLSAIEALLFLWVTLKIIFSVGLRRAWRTIGADPTIQFCLIFAIIFAFAVGLSSGNFGTLSRYRIPCLPFYGLAMVLIYYKNKPLDKNILAFKW
jgi:hypothetical protein